MQAYTEDKIRSKILDTTKTSKSAHLNQETVQRIHLSKAPEPSSTTYTCPHTGRKLQISSTAELFLSIIHMSLGKNVNFLQDTINTKIHNLRQTSRSTLIPIPGPSVTLALSTTYPLFNLLTRSWECIMW